MPIAMHNNMTKLLTKLEIRLGTKALSLPSECSKDTWAEVIQLMSLDTFSRFFPNKIVYGIDLVNDKGKDDYYYLDQDLFEGVEILGIRDLCLDNFYKNTNSANINNTYGMMNSMGYEDLVMAQMSYDSNSLFNNTIFVDYVPPNKVKIDMAGGFKMPTMGNDKLDIEVFIKHADNLATIEPTKMETFEALALIDIKVYLYNTLKHYNNLETVFLNTDLKIDDWSNAEDDRKSFVSELEDKYVSAANKNQPMMLTV